MSLNKYASLQSIGLIIALCISISSDVHAFTNPKSTRQHRHTKIKNLNYRQGSELIRLNLSEISKTEGKKYESIYIKIFEFYILKMILLITKMRGFSMSIYKIMIYEEQIG